jgi:large subunit ribosomal protein L17
MRHNRETHRFNRNPKERKAMLENLVSSLIHHQQITTTLQKAKAAQRLADRVISLGKQDSLSARRQVFSYLQDHTLTSKLFKEVAPRFKTRSGGYTRILHLSRRKGDGAELALLELTEKEITVKEAKPKSKKEPKHDGHEHKHGAVQTKAGGATAPAKGGSASGGKTPEKGAHAKPEQKKDKPKSGFFSNVSKFFRNKGGG